MDPNKRTLRFIEKSKGPRITKFILKKKKNVKSLPEKNIYYETTVIVENLAGAHLGSSEVFFIGCCGCCSLLLIFAQLLGRIVLGQ